VSPTLHDRTLWTYLLVFDDAFGTEKEVQDFLTTMNDVDWWYRCLPNAIFVTAYLTAKNLSGELRKRFPRGRHIVLDCNTDREGFLPRKAWNLIRRPAKRGDE
jgi:hypothetical protein